ncbi:MAG: hypothetical protein AAF327_19340 [Cyanobacteria bacterium P01_A01_bin.37]
MKRQKVVIKKVMSPDGRVVAEAQSVVSDDGSDDATFHQAVDVGYSSDGVWSHSSSVSSSS